MPFIAAQSTVFMHMVPLGHGVGDGVGVGVGVGDGGGDAPVGGTITYVCILEQITAHGKQREPSAGL